MGLSFILGRAGSGKTARVLREAAEELAARPKGPPLLLLVPEQATFQTERALLAEVRERTGRRGFARAQVVSFQRLAWLVAKKTGGEAEPLLGEVGRRMVLRALLHRKSGEWRIFDRVAGRPGFVASLAATVAELRRQGVGVPELRAGLLALAQAGEPSEVLAAKLGDLAGLMEAYEAYLAGGRRDPSERLTVLAARLREAAFLAGARVWVDGFASFTPQELAVLAELLTVAEEVTVALCLDPDEAGEGEPDEAALFHPTLETRRRLLRAAGERGVPAARVLALREAPRFRAPELAHVERQLFEYPGERFSGPAPAITLVAAPDRRAEVEAAAREIRARAREGMRFRDMAIIVRDAERYGDLVTSVFADHRIPVFIDALRQAGHHPLVEGLLAAVEAVARDWPYEQVFRFLKTDLPDTPREAVDELENYVLEFGIAGRLWRDERPWAFRRRFSLEEASAEDPAEDARLRRVDDARRSATAALVSYHRRVSGARLPVWEHARALWTLLDELGAWDRVHAWSEEAEARGDLEAAQEHLQVLSGVAGVLQEMAEHLGGFEMDLAELLGVLQAGLSAISSGLIPPGLDQVTVGSVERSRHPAVRMAFVLGASEDAWPKPQVPDVIFNDREREALARRGVELGETARQRSLHEQYLTYVAVSRASEALWISHPAADEAGRAVAPAFFVRRIGLLVPGAARRAAEAFPSPWESEVPTRFAAALAARLGRERERRRLGRPPGREGEEAAALLALARGDGRIAPHLEPLLASVAYRHEGTRLPAELAASLYGREVRASVTRLESFAACPFQHFARHGLDLAPRAVWEMGAPQVGSLYHAALSLFTRRIAESGRAWTDLDEASIRAEVEAAVAEILPRLENEVVAARARQGYLRRVVARTLVTAVTLLVRHARFGSFRPRGVEVPFGTSADDALPGLRLDLRDGRTILLHGRIDRIEEAEGRGGRRLLRVVDFKSSRRTLDLSSALAGLALQLGLYLLVAVEDARAAGRPAEPAGLLYFRVADPVVDAPPGVAPDEVAKLRLKDLRTEGWILGDDDVIAAMDERREGELVPVELRKDGTPKRASRVLTARQMDALLEALRRRAGELGRAMLDGEADARPFRIGQETACDLCDLKPVCQFDPQVDGFAYRPLSRRPAREILERLEGGGA